MLQIACNLTLLLGIEKTAKGVLGALEQKTKPRVDLRSVAFEDPPVFAFVAVAGGRAIRTDLPIAERAPGRTWCCHWHR